MAAEVNVETPVARRHIEQLLNYRPAWRDRFAEVYRLQPTESVKLMAPPFEAARNHWFLCDHSRLVAMAESVPASATFAWNDTLSHESTQFGGENTLHRVMANVLALKRHECQGSEELLDLKLPGDWIVRRNASRKDRANELSEIVREQTGKSVRIEQSTTTTEALVVAGDFQLARDDDAPARANWINVYFEKKFPGGGGGGGSGTLTKFFEVFADYVANRPVSIAADLPEDEVFQWRWHDARTIWRDTEPEPAHRRLETVFTNVSRQTSLTFATKTAEIPVWRVIEE